MTKHLLLLGAGFSRNWGGWLASETFEYLLACPEIVSDPGLKALLWKHKRKGAGFEGALEEVQGEYSARLSTASKERLDKLQGAITRMFNDMNAAFDRIVDFDPSNEVGKRACDFLHEFDAIFTLNQDLLLECHYERQMGKPVAYPGVRPRPSPRTKLVDERWDVLPTIEPVPANAQPIYKLHGSAGWIGSNGEAMLVMGGNKSAAIQSSPILRRYHEIFAEQLNEPGARLMVIGYGFGDEHINRVLLEAGKSGLGIFVIDPLGVDVVNKTRDAAIKAPDPMEELLIGASRRSLSEIFGGNDEVERSKVLRFFDRPLRFARV